MGYFAYGQNHPSSDEPTSFLRITKALELLEPLSLNLNFWRAQNIYFSLKEQLRAEKDERVKGGDESSKQWINAFNDLGKKLRIKIS